MAVDSKNNFWKELGIWFGLNIVVAGFACIILLLLKDHFLGHKGLFYVFNKEGYSGYFYAWSIALIAGSLFSLLKCWAEGQESKGKIALVVFSIIWLIIVVGSYLSHNEQVAVVSAEKIVKNLDIKELTGEELYTKYYVTKEIHPDTLIARVWETKNTDSVVNYFEKNIDKKQLAETLLQVKVKMEKPQIHYNWLYIVLTFVSFLIALLTFILTYPKPKK